MTLRDLGKKAESHGGRIYESGTRLRYEITQHQPTINLSDFVYLLLSYISAAISRFLEMIPVEIAHWEDERDVRMYWRLVMMTRRQQRQNLSMCSLLGFVVPGFIKKSINFVGRITLFAMTTNPNGSPLSPSDELRSRGITEVSGTSKSNTRGYIHQF